jgi:hypothetical protein
VPAVPAPSHAAAISAHGRGLGARRARTPFRNSGPSSWASHELARSTPAARRSLLLVKFHKTRYASHDAPPPLPPPLPPPSPRRLSCVAHSGGVVPAPARPRRDTRRNRAGSGSFARRRHRIACTVPATAGPPASELPPHPRTPETSAEAASRPALSATGQAPSSTSDLRRTARPSTPAKRAAHIPSADTPANQCVAHYPRVRPRDYDRLRPTGVSAPARHGPGR